MDLTALQTFYLEQHARSHAAALSGSFEPLTEDAIVAGLSDAQLRLRPHPLLNSIAWLLWHIARSEDVAINVLVGEGAQVLDEVWNGRLGLTRRDMGTGMDDAEVAEVAARINLAALPAYRLAVGRRTREVVQQLEPRDWDTPIDPERLLRAGAFAHAADGERRVAEYWRGRTKRFVLASSVTTHSYLHLGEAGAVRALLRSERR